MSSSNNVFYKYLHGHGGVFPYYVQFAKSGELCRSFLASSFSFPEVQIEIVERCNRVDWCTYSTSIPIERNSINTLIEKTAEAILEKEDTFFKGPSPFNFETIVKGMTVGGVSYDANDEPSNAVSVSCEKINADIKSRLAKSQLPTVGVVVTHTCKATPVLEFVYIDLTTGESRVEFKLAADGFEVLCSATVDEPASIDLDCISDNVFDSDSSAESKPLVDVGSTNRQLIDFDAYDD